MHATPKTLVCAIVCAWLLSLFAGLSAQAASLDLAQFSARDAQGKPLALEQYKGKTVLLHFWATWCAPCVEELPAIDALQKKYEGQLVVLALSEDLDAASVSAFMKARKLENLPVLIDEKSTVFRAVKGLGLPYSMLLDAKGEIRLRHPGSKKDWDQFTLPTK